MQSDILCFSFNLIGLRFLLNALALKMVNLVLQETNTLVVALKDFLNTLLFGLSNSFTHAVNFDLISKGYQTNYCKVLGP